MNTFIHFTTLLIISAVYFSACTTKPYSQEISIIVDQTETYFRHFTLDELRKVSAITCSENNGEHISFHPITEFGFNEEKSFKLDPVENLLMGNDFEREREVLEYFSGIDSTVTEFKNGKEERIGSVIYKILAEELNRLNESMADKRILIINSDLMEKSFIDFYSYATFSELQRNPEKIQKVLLEKYTLKDLTGIEVYIIYMPIDKSDSEKFEIVSDFYKVLLQSHGAKVNVKGSL